MTTKEKELIQEIVSLISSIKEHTDMLNTEKRIPVLELNMVLSKINNLHEKIVVLKYLHAHIEEIIEKHTPLQIETLEEILIEEKVEEPQIRTEEHISDNIPKQPVDSLLKKIGINDKFLFISELFDRNEKEYNECIQHLNQLDNFLDADTYIRNTLRKKYDWNLNKASVARFIEIVERRYL